MNKIINFETTKKDYLLISKIVKRGIELAKKYDAMTMNMDVTAVHANGTELDLDKFLKFDDFNFSHDLFGIRDHINRETGKLENCFSPRCSV